LALPDGQFCLRLVGRETPPMSTMLEKMAVAMAVCEMRRNGMSEALCEAASAHPQTVAVALENYGPKARAALLTIREPDAVMRLAGRDYDGVGNQPAIKGFTAMIDAILNEKPEAPTT